MQGTVSLGTQQHHTVPHDLQTAYPGLYLSCFRIIAKNYRRWAKCKNGEVVVNVNAPSIGSTLDTCMKGALLQTILGLPVLEPKYSRQSHFSPSTLTMAKSELCLLLVTDDPNANRVLFQTS